LGTWTWNILGTHWELGKNEKQSPSPPKLKRKRGKGPWMHAWAFPLVAWNFSSQKTSSPFLAWANAPCKEHPTYSVLGHIWFLKIINGYKWTKWTLIHNTLVFCLFDHFAWKMGLQTSVSTKIP
jgi:hypothetical protein